MSIFDAEQLAGLDGRWDSFDPRYENAYFAMGHISVDEISSTLDGLSELDEPWTFLDDLKEKEDPTYYATKSIIGCLSPETVADAFGPKMLLWVAASSVKDKVRDRMLEASAQSYGTDIDLFKKARAWAWQNHARNDTSYISAMYDFFKDMVLGDPLGQIELEPILAARSLAKKPFSSGRVADYDLIPMQSWGSNTAGYAKDWNTEIWPSKRYHVYLDAPVGFALTYKEQPQAVVGLSMDSPDELIVTQIQGVQAYHVDEGKNVVGKIAARGLAPLDWVNCMIDVAEGVAIQRGLGAVCIQSAGNNIWARELPGCEDAHVSVERITKIYDTPAQARGYSLGEDKNWHRPVSAVN